MNKENESKIESYLNTATILLWGVIIGAPAGAGFLFYFVVSGTPALPAIGISMIIATVIAATVSKNMHSLFIFESFMEDREVKVVEK